MYIYEVQTAYIFTKGLRLNDANKVIKLIEICLYCYCGYFVKMTPFHQLYEPAVGRVV